MRRGIEAKPHVWAKHLRHMGKRFFWHAERSAQKQLTNQLVKEINNGNR